MSESGAPAAVPQVLADTRVVLAGATSAGAAGAVWRLTAQERDLDANVIRLPAGDGIAAHDGPDLDVLILVLEGGAVIDTETGSIEVSADSLLWLPRRSRRAITAGPDGVAYLSVHQRRQALVPTGLRSPAIGDR